MKIHRVVITSGEPAGIGPDLIVQIAQNNWPVELVVCADVGLLEERAALLGLPLKILLYTPNNQPVAQCAGTITVLPIQLSDSVILGKINVKNSNYVLNTLVRACDGCQCNEFAALVTGPVHKGVMNDAGIPFTGHTDFLKKRTKSQTAVMMLTTKMLRVALATTHLPVRKISENISMNLLRNVITVIHNDLHKRFNIQSPNILVCGLNPHAGEGGYIGREEIDIIIPILEELKKKGICLNGPLSADTIFQPKYIKSADVILAMYHDQGLPVIKYQGFNHGVNVTLGLPFIRTSVDHGTALHLTGQGQANANSFMMAVDLAIRMIKNNHD